MTLKPLLAGLALAGAMLGTIGPGLAGAAPTNAPGATSDVFACSDGTTITIVSNGGGAWTPGHVVAIDGATATQTLIPLAFSGTFYPEDGQTPIAVFSLVKSGQHTGIIDTRTCSMSDHVDADQPDNPFGVGGDFIFTATVFEAGNGH